MTDFDYVIVGAGLFGATCARLLTDAGKRVLVVEKRDHIGGNCHTVELDGILVQRYGGHIFHTNDFDVWQFVQRFAEWQGYEHRVQAFYHGRFYSLPVNLWTLNQVFNVNTPAGAEEAIKDPEKLKTLYEMFYVGYSEKQWGRPFNEIPRSIIKRLPIRTTWDDRYFSDRFQAMPVGGYTKLVERMLAGVAVELNTDFLADLSHWTNGRAWKVLYSGPIDALFAHDLGRLEYRSLVFKDTILPGDFQGSATVNYTDREKEFTRILEHKHYWRRSIGHTWITQEYPCAHDETNDPYYPIRDETNTALYQRYAERVKQLPWLKAGGRLGSYQYLNMDQAIAQAMKLVRDLAKEAA